MKIKLVLVFLLAQLVLAGCASYSYTDAPPSIGFVYSKYAYIGYEGDLREVEDVGVVTTDGLIKIVSVNGQPLSKVKVYKSSGLYSGGRVQLHLLPGVHELGLAFSDLRDAGFRAWSTSDIMKTISIEKGQVIHLSLSLENKSTWTAMESDGRSALATITSDFEGLVARK